jgi:SOS-response transcriptional repressor LexA
MATITRIKPGQVLFTVTRQKMGNTTISRGVMHRVVVKEVDPDGRFVIASWNGNAACKFYERDVARWKVNEPQPKGTRMGMPNY